MHTKKFQRERLSRAIQKWQHHQQLFTPVLLRIQLTTIFTQTIFNLFLHVFVLNKGNDNLQIPKKKKKINYQVRNKKISAQKKRILKIISK